MSRPCSASSGPLRGAASCVPRRPRPSSRSSCSSGSCSSPRNTRSRRRRSARYERGRHRLSVNHGSIGARRGEGSPRTAAGRLRFEAQRREDRPGAARGTRDRPGRFGAAVHLPEGHAWIRASLMRHRGRLEGPLREHLPHRELLQRLHGPGECPDPVRRSKDCHAHRPLARGGFPRTRDVGPHGRRVHGPSEPHADPAAGGLQVPSAPEGIRPGGRPPVHHPAQAPRGEVSAGVLDQHGTAASHDPWPLEHEGQGRRGDGHRREAGDRLPPPRIREDHGGPRVSEERRPDGPTVLRLLDHLVPRVLPRGREDDGDRDPGAGPVDPRRGPRTPADGVPKISAAEAINWGVTGPNLRACGVNVDLRRLDPYEVYEEIDFEPQVWHDGGSGDSYARFVCRFNELRESCQIILQALEKMPKTGPYRVKAPRRAEGEGYAKTEDSRGEALFYVIGDGDDRPYRVKIRSPVFCTMAATPLMLRGNKLADSVAILGSVDVCVGEMDK